MKYFFLSEGWTVGRVWEVSGLWNEQIWRRSPHVQKLDLGISENNELLWLFEVEEAVLMVEVKPTATVNLDHHTIGQVVLKRLITAEQAIDKLIQAVSVLKASNLEVLSHSSCTGN